MAKKVSKKISAQPSNSRQAKKIPTARKPAVVNTDERRKRQLREAQQRRRDRAKERKGSDFETTLPIIPAVKINEPVNEAVAAASILRRKEQLAAAKARYVEKKKAEKRLRLEAALQTDVDLPSLDFSVNQKGSKKKVVQVQDDLILVPAMPQVEIIEATSLETRKESSSRKQKENAKKRILLGEEE